MLLSSEEWSRIAKKPPMLKISRYVLCYFLGELSSQRRKKIDKFAQDNNCQVINILDYNDPFYECGPKEFLYLEKNAYAIFTDSYHSSVFAFLFCRPFLIFNREDILVNMNSRIETFINKFCLTDRKYDEKEITNKILSVNYDLSFKILAEEKEKSFNYLIEAIEEKKSDCNEL